MQYIDLIIFEKLCKTPIEMHLLDSKLYLKSNRKPYLFQEIIANKYNNFHQIYDMSLGLRKTTPYHIKSHKLSVEQNIYIL